MGIVQASRVPLHVHLARSSSHPRMPWPWIAHCTIELLEAAQYVPSRTPDAQPQPSERHGSGTLQVGGLAPPPPPPPPPLPVSPHTLQTDRNMVVLKQLATSSLSGSIREDALSSEVFLVQLLTHVSTLYSVHTDCSSGQASAILVMISVVGGMCHQGHPGHPGHPRVVDACRMYTAKGDRARLCQWQHCPGEQRMSVCSRYTFCARQPGSGSLA